MKPTLFMSCHLTTKNLFNPSPGSKNQLLRTLFSQYNQTSKSSKKDEPAF